MRWLLVFLALFLCKPVSLVAQETQWNRSMTLEQVFSYEPYPGEKERLVNHQRSRVSDRKRVSFANGFVPTTSGDGRLGDG
ncbi:MAG: hypothetical protein ACQESL_10080, partial [Bacteroidota bacterium]